MTDAEIRSYLRDNGYPDHIVRGGKVGLITRWLRFVEEVEQGYEFGLEDYRNDLDLRGVIRLIDADVDVAEADERFQAMLTHTDQRVWESSEGRPFWDYGFPRNASRALLADLRSEGLIE
jgi:hypothetical protein